MNALKRRPDISGLSSPCGKAHEIWEKLRGSCSGKRSTFGASDYSEAKIENEDEDKTYMHGGGADGARCRGAW
ncbi:MAG: hypothetical protein J6W24_01060 [Prevotella sp.]|nr:hypothetical protein [Prevotella sp.]